MFYDVQEMSKIYILNVVGIHFSVVHGFFMVVVAVLYEEYQ